MRHNHFWDQILTQIKESYHWIAYIIVLLTLIIGIGGMGYILMHNSFDWFEIESLEQEHINTISTSKTDTIYEIKELVPDSIAQQYLGKYIGDSIGNKQISHTILVQHSTAETDNRRFSAMEQKNFLWALFGIFISALIAIIALIFQMQTSFNTAAALKKKESNQLVVLNDMLEKTIWTLAELLAIYTLMEKSARRDRLGKLIYTQCPHEARYPYMKHRTQLLDIESPKSDQQSKTLANLYHSLELQNEYLETLKKILPSPNITGYTKQTLILPTLTEYASTVYKILSYIKQTHGEESASKSAQECVETFRKNLQEEDSIKKEELDDYIISIINKCAEYIVIFSSKKRDAIRIPATSMLIDLVYLTLHRHDQKRTYYTRKIEFIDE